MIGETKQISDRPPRFETSINMHGYASGSAGWYRIEIVGMGTTEADAQKNARERLEKALVAISVARVSHRVPEILGATEG